MKYYLVSTTGKVITQKTATISGLEGNGFKVQESRLIGDMDVFKNGNLVAQLFNNKLEAVSYFDSVR